MLKYTNINHCSRKRLGISWMEYGLADMIYRLSNNPKSPFPGWCFMSRPTMAKEMGVSKQTILNYIDKLEALDLVQKNPDTSYLKTTERWYTEVEIRSDDEDDGGQKVLPGGQKVLSEGVKKIDEGGPKSLPYKGINKNSKNTTLSLSENSKIQRTESGAIDASSLKPVTAESKPKEAPPVAPPPPEIDPEAVIVSKLDPGPASQLMDVWKMHSGATYEKIAESFQSFAGWWIDKQCVGMSDAEIDSLVTRTGSKAFRASFKKSFLPRINNKTANGTSTNPKKSKYIRPDDLPRLYPEFYPAESNSGTSSANGDNPNTEQEFEIVSEPNGSIFAKHPFS